MNKRQKNIALVKYRYQLNMTQKQFAEAVGVSPWMVSYAENGGSVGPKVRELILRFIKSHFPEVKTSDIFPVEQVENKLAQAAKRTHCRR